MATDELGFAPGSVCEVAWGTRPGNPGRSAVPLAECTSAFDTVVPYLAELAVRLAAAGAALAPPARSVPSPRFSSSHAISYSE